MLECGEGCLPRLRFRSLPSMPQKHTHVWSGRCARKHVGGLVYSLPRLDVAHAHFRGRGEEVDDFIFIQWNHGINHDRATRIDSDHLTDMKLSERSKV